MNTFLLKDINHIVLDFEKNNSIVSSWTLNFIIESKNYNNINSLYNLKKSYFEELYKNKLLINE